MLLPYERRDGVAPTITPIHEDATCATARAEPSGPSRLSRRPAAHMARGRERRVARVAPGRGERRTDRLRRPGAAVRLPAAADGRRVGRARNIDHHEPLIARPPFPDLDDE